MNAATPSRYLASAAATTVVTALVGGLAFTLGARGAALADGRRLGLADLVLVGWLAVAVLIVVGLMRQARNPRPVGLLPIGVQSGLRRFLELSAFGAGSLRGWTLTHPDTTLDRVARPGPVPPMHNSTITPLAPAPATPHPDRTSTNAANQPSPSSLATPTETRRYRVRRGDTWWSLAEGHLGDGRRWHELQDLNLGRPVAPGVVITDGTVLSVGWAIALPASPTPDQAAAPTRIPASDPSARKGP